MTTETARVSPAAATAPTTVRVEITLDLICSASFIAFTRFRRAAARHRADGGRVDVVIRPFELDPGASTEGEPLLDAITAHFGPGAVEGTRAAAADAAREGILLDYDRAIATGTFEAHRLIARAAAQGRAEETVDLLFRAHFSEGRHIGDPAVLAAIADAARVADDGSGAAELRADLDRVRRSGVRGVPVFRVGGGPAFTGARSEEALLDAVRRAAAG
jgi:predicted DsbA family dithiol-disulfide isomerase